MAKKNSAAKTAAAPRTRVRKGAAPFGREDAAETPSAQTAPEGSNNSATTEGTETMNSATEEVQDSSAAPAVAQGTFVYQTTEKHGRASRYSIPGVRGSIYVPHALIVGGAAEGFAPPAQLTTDMFVAPNPEKAAKSTATGERKAKSIANAASAASKLQERIAKRAAQDAKDAERLRKLQAKLGQAPAANGASAVAGDEQVVSESNETAAQPQVQ
jgi:hypothetical protein